MRNLKKLLLVLIFLAVAAVVLVFVLENQQAVALSFLGWSSPSLPVSVFVLAALAAPPFLPPLREGTRFGSFLRPEPPCFLPPRSPAFTVAHARRSASFSGTPRSS